MKLEIIALKADTPYTIGRGRVVRLLEAARPVKIETQALSTSDNQNGTLLANIGAEFKTFQTAQLMSESDQVITIAYSELEIYDNRLGVNGALIVESVSRGAALCEMHNISLAAGVRVQILPADSRRRTALVSTTGPVVVYPSAAAATGFTVDGVLEHECSGELWAQAAAVQTVEIVEYLN